MRDTIRHPRSATKAIVAYLSVAGEPPSGTRIRRYLSLMHWISYVATDHALWRLRRKGRIRRDGGRRGVYMLSKETA